MAMISYARNREDVLLNRVFQQASSGFYVDVGANEPTNSSVTRHFYDLGWRGINIEPNPCVFAILQRERPNDINLNVGVADKNDTIDFYEFNQPNFHELSTFDANVREEHVRNHGLSYVVRPMPVTTLSEVFRRHCPRRVDFLKVDVEGFEKQALTGLDWTKYRPRVVLVEATRPLTMVQNHLEWDPILTNNRYRFAYFDGINRYYVVDEEPSLLEAFQIPVNVLDDFVPFEYLRQIQSLEQAVVRLSLESGINISDPSAAVELSDSVMLLYKLKQLSARWPRMAVLAKRLLRAANGRNRRNDTRRKCA